MDEDGQNPDDRHQAGEPDPVSPFSHDRIGHHTSERDSHHCDPELGAEWQRLIAELRRVMAASVELDVPSDTVRELADRVRELANHMGEKAPGRGVPLYGSGWRVRTEPTDLATAMPFSPVIGTFNPLASPLRVTLEDERVIARGSFNSLYQGAPGLVHGSMISACYDELLAMAGIVKHIAGPTARLTVHFRKPTPLDTELRFEAWIERSAARYTLARGRCLIGDERVTDAEGLFARLAPRTTPSPK
jgi:acyl-coenzyme A thioesterase PaaI-like protein